MADSADCPEMGQGKTSHRVATAKLPPRYRHATAKPPVSLGVASGSFGVAWGKLMVGKLIVDSGGRRSVDSLPGIRTLRVT